jgi:hypothetical protein
MEPFAVIIYDLMYRNILKNRKAITRQGTAIKDMLVRFCPADLKDNPRDMIDNIIMSAAVCYPDPIIKIGHAMALESTLDLHEKRYS